VHAGERDNVRPEGARASEVSEVPVTSSRGLRCSSAAVVREVASLMYGDVQRYVGDAAL
jgi:hypothetical protein